MKENISNKEEKLTIIPLDQFTQLFPALRNDMGHFVFGPPPADADEQRAVARIIFESIKNLKEGKPARRVTTLVKISLSLMLNLPQELIDIIWQYSYGRCVYQGKVYEEKQWSFPDWFTLLTKCPRRINFALDGVERADRIKRYKNTLLLHSPWYYNEEHQNLINFLIEKKQYKPVLERNDVLHQILPHIFPTVPVDTLNIISGYDQNTRVSLVNGEEQYNNLVKLLSEEEQYKPLKRNEILQQILPHILPVVPINILNIISDYDQNTRESLIEEIENFIEKIKSAYDRSLYSHMEYVFGEYIPVLNEFLAALWSLHHSSQISPNDASLEIVTAFITGKVFYKNLPIKNPAVLSMQEQAPTSNPIPTLLPMVMEVVNYKLDVDTIKTAPRIFSYIRAIIDSFCPLSVNIPSHFIFLLTQEIEKSLYNHVKNLKLGNELKVLTLNGIKDLNNEGGKPELLIKTLKVLDEKGTRIIVNGAGGFFIKPQNVETGIRLLNYHKRSDVLKILCDYIYVNKDSFLKRAPKYSEQAKNLMSRLLNTPYGSSKVYVFINEIDKFISASGTESPEYQQYLNVLVQVKEKLINEILPELSINSNSFKK